jgi:hypothetical protein
MKKNLNCLVLSLTLICGVNLNSQTLDFKKIEFEPYKPFFVEYNIMKNSTLKLVNGKYVWVDESEDSYRIRNAEHKKKLYSDYINSKDYKQWLIEEKAWQDRNTDWKERTRYPELKDDVKVTTMNNTEPVIGDNYIVNSTTLNLRTEANKNASIITPLKVGDVLKLINADNASWWFVEFLGNKGYVFSKYLDHDPYSGWEKKNYSSGTTPECENVNPKYDYTLDNYLKIDVGSNTDVVVKLMKIGSYSDECIRIVYVRSNESFNIKNIPEGKYYLKIAYGKDYRQKIMDGNCVVKFIKHAQYEKGVDILDFNKEKGPNETRNGKTYETWSLPSFTLSLDIIISDSDQKTYSESTISEDEFNK